MKKNVLVKNKKSLLNLGEFSTSSPFIPTAPLIRFSWFLFLSNKNKKVCTALNYTEHFYNLVFAVTVCTSASAFASLVDISKRIMSSTKWLNICAIMSRIKNYKPFIKKDKKKHDEIALSVKSKLHCTKYEVFSLGFP